MRPNVSSRPRTGLEVPDSDMRRVARSHHDLDGAKDGVLRMTSKGKLVVDSPRSFSARLARLGGAAAKQHLEEQRREAAEWVKTHFDESFGPGAQASVFKEEPRASLSMKEFDQLAVQGYMHRNKLDAAKSILDHDEAKRQFDSGKKVASIKEATDEDALKYLLSQRQV